MKKIYYQKLQKIKLTQNSAVKPKGDKTFRLSDLQKRLSNTINKQKTLINKILTINFIDGKIKSDRAKLPI